MRHHAKRVLWVLAGAALACAGPAFGSDIYVYQADNGSRLITDHPRIEAGYRLVKVYSEDDLWNQTTAAPRPPMKPRPSAYDGLIDQAARRARLDPLLVKSVMHAESGFNPNAVSRKGARGLMQLMPGTAARYGVSHVFDPHENVMGGARYLSHLLDRFDGRLELALAGYNAGENAVTEAGGIPPYDETRRYVTKVMRLYRQYKRGSCRQKLDTEAVRAKIISCSGGTPAPVARREVDVGTSSGTTLLSADSDDRQWRPIE